MCDQSESIIPQANLIRAGSQLTRHARMRYPIADHRSPVADCRLPYTNAREGRTSLALSQRALTTMAR